MELYLEQVRGDRIQCIQMQGFVFVKNLERILMIIGEKVEYMDKRVSVLEDVVTVVCRIFFLIVYNSSVYYSKKFKKK